MFSEPLIGYYRSSKLLAPDPLAAGDVASDRTRSEPTMAQNPRIQQRIQQT